MFPNSKTLDKNHDNDRKLTEFEVELETISRKTGLKFSLGEQLGDLSMVDKEGLNKTKREYD